MSDTRFSTNTDDSDLWLVGTALVAVSCQPNDTKLLWRGRCCVGKKAGGGGGGAAGGTGREFMLGAAQSV